MRCSRPLDARNHLVADDPEKDADPSGHWASRVGDRQFFRGVAALVLGVGFWLISCGLGASATEIEPEVAIERLRVDVVKVYSHDRGAFTQGLLWHEGQIFESTGGYGSSSLRRVELESGRVVQLADLPRELFGEGLARVGDRLVQLTWQEGIAAIWDIERFEILGELAYGGEGWGLCFDGKHLVMSDGSDHLFFREPESLAEDRRVQVTLEGRPLQRINELECVGGDIWANVWTTEMIVRIDAETGRVTATVDASGLLEKTESRGANVLNGIAYREEEGTFLITGKNWPKIFEVEFVPIP